MFYARLEVRPIGKHDVILPMKKATATTNLSNRETIAKDR
jgi:hypothetical protein